MKAQTYFRWKRLLLRRADSHHAGNVMSLTSSQRTLLECVINDFTEHRVAPSTARLAGLRNTSPERILKTLEQLKAKGFLAQPYEDGPWVPLQSAEGDPFIVRAGISMNLRGKAEILGDIVGPLY